MAIYYIDDTATGANNGSSWADAWTSIGSVTGLSVGDEVRIRYTHNEVSGNFGGSNEVTYISMDNDDTYLRGATFDLSGGLIGDGVMVGLNFDDLFRFKPTVAKTFVAIDCHFSRNGSFKWIDGTVNEDNLMIFRDCEFDIQNNNSHDTDSPNTQIFYNCVFTGNSRALGDVHNLECYGCSFTGFTHLYGGGSASALFANCEIPSGAVVGAPAQPYRHVTLTNCGAGTLSTPALSIYKRLMDSGEIQSVLSRYRTGGADDGEQANPYSWEMASNANAKWYNPLIALPIAAWVTGGSSKTFTIYIASNVTLDDGDFWVEMAGPDDAVSPTAFPHFVNTGKNPYETQASLSTDVTSTWNGTGVGTKQKIEITYTPQISGIVQLRLFLAKPSTTVYVDPKIYVT